MRKGVDVLIESFRLLTDKAPQLNATLCIVGDGPERGTVERLARNSGYLNRILLAGHQVNVRAYMRACEIFVLPSRREPFGLVLAEAREEGCAIVASDVDGIPDVLENGSCGVLVPPGNAAEFAAQIERLLSDEDALQIARNRAKFDVSWLSIARCATETDSVYRTAILGKSGGS